MKQKTQTPYAKIEKALIKTMSKQYTASVNKQQHLLDEALTLDEYEPIIESTINKYNYNGHNFNPKYLPVIIAMALKEQEFQSIQDVTWNNISKERPTQKNENAILKENLDTIYKFMKHGYDNRNVSENEDDWDRGYDTGFNSALGVLRWKIEMMTEEKEEEKEPITTEQALENKMYELAEAADKGYVRLE